MQRTDESNIENVTYSICRRSQRDSSWCIAITIVDVQLQKASINIKTTCSICVTEFDGIAQIQSIEDRGLCVHERPTEDDEEKHHRVSRLPSVI